MLNANALSWKMRPMYPTPIHESKIRRSLGAQSKTQKLALIDEEYTVYSGIYYYIPFSINLGLPFELYMYIYMLQQSFRM